MAALLSFQNYIGGSDVQVIELLILTPIVHRFANIFAHSIKLKEVPW